ncbi:hypothetical protein QBC44DRAFT_49206 [Cladorrhinum sp. PSN332]|nr:hypothetical protein QBC44DRAFT_49206 [Cladorrhinum sp. PSN332]
MEDEFLDDFFDDWEPHGHRNTSSPQSAASVVLLDESEGGDSDENGLSEAAETFSLGDSSPLHQWGDSSSRQSSEASSRQSSEASSEDSLFVGQAENMDDDERDREEANRISGLPADARARFRRIDALNGDLGFMGGNRVPEGARATAQRGGRDNDHESRRHHPYRNSQQSQHNRRGNMDLRFPRRLGSVDDELIEMEVAPIRRSRGPSNNRRTPVPDRDVIIDLTGEPSSPEAGPLALPNRPPGFPTVVHRNPRRQTSHLQRTPSLARSDGSLLGNGSRTVPIDLTMDDDPAPPPAALPMPREPRHAPNNANPHLPDFFRQHFANFPDFPDFRASLNSVGMPRVAQAIGNLVNRQIPDIDLHILGINGPVNPLGNNVPDLRYAYGVAGRRADPPQPKHVPPPPAPEGFTRDTGGDNVIVCAGCEEELQFCPEDEDAKRKTPPAKKAKSRKDMEEHYFWALKDCGHVYCKSCYENRSTKKQSPFRPATDNNRKLICAVPDCGTEVGTKLAWVGLFL